MRFSVWTTLDPSRNLVHFLNSLYNSKFALFDSVINVWLVYDLPFKTVPSFGCPLFISSSSLDRLSKGRFYRFACKDLKISADWKEMNEIKRLLQLDSKTTASWTVVFHLIFEIFLSNFLDLFILKRSYGQTCW